MVKKVDDITSFLLLVNFCPHHMLPMDVFEDFIGKKLPTWLRNTVINFLSSRKCAIDVKEVKSTLRGVPLGCFQGSVLGLSIARTTHTQKMAKKISTGSTRTNVVFKHLNCDKNL